MSQVSEFLKEVKRGNVNLEEHTSQILEECKRLDKRYGFFITICEKDALDRARELDKLIEAGKTKGALLGLPISAKDCICTKGIQSTAGSKILQGYIPPFNATVIENVEKEGGIVIGKTAQDEFGFGTFSIHCAYKIPKNPWDPERSCGGSSGGAAGVAASLSPHVAIAESTGGSISCPASFTSTVGITPTYGRVSRYGLIDYANSLDKIGSIGAKVEDATLLLSILSGYDPRDSTSLKTEENFTSYLNKKISKFKLGVPKEYFGEGVDERIVKKVWNSIHLLENLGAEYEKCSLPTTKYAIPSYYIIAMAEASTNLAKFCGLRYGLHEKLEGNYDEYFSKIRTNGFGEEAKRRVMLGTYARMAGYREQYYLKALKVRALIIQDFKKAFKKYDVLIAPTMPILPPKFSEIEKLTPLENYLMDVLTVAPNLAGIPMLSLPCGFINNLPVGIHFLGDHLQEGKIIQLASAFERETRITDKKPRLK